MKAREVWVVSIALGLLTWQLLVPGFIGIANNGDFAKIAGRLCIGGPDEAAYNFLYFRSDYVRDAQYCYEAQMPSSEHWIAWLASASEEHLGDRRRFDIRWLGAVHLIGWLIAFALLLVSIRGLQGFGWWIAAAASIVIFCDVAYVSYFNSFFTDAAALIGGFGMVACLPTLLRRFAWAPAFGAAAFLFVTSKPQHALLAAVPATVLIASAVTFRRLMPALLACAVLAGAAWVIHNSQSSYTAQARFSIIFFKLLPESTSPARDAAELGLGPDDLKYVGLRAFLPNSPTGDPEWVRGFAGRNSSMTLLRFYLHHPSLVCRFLRDVLYREAWQMRPLNLSNFRQQDSHPAGARTNRMAMWSAVRSRLLVLCPSHMILFYGLALIGGFWKRNWTIVCAVARGGSEFAIASLGDVLETYRHLLLFHLFTDATIFFVLGVVASSISVSQIVQYSRAIHNRH